ncbi:MAG TPA: hypothetical protein VFY05_00730 [Candidatus Angelobacter sp.]|nr:hypothetical protein [Candidatus Angelobacter sp.]
MDSSLRPMSTSQVLDRTFSLYRQNFLLFAGIAAVPPAFLLLGQLGFVAAGNVTVFSRRPELQVAGIVAAVLTAIVLIALWLIGYALATGASVYAVTRVHLGHKTSIAEAYKMIFPATGTILGIVVLEFLVIAGAVIAVMMVFIVPLIALGVVPKGRAAAAPGVLAVLAFLFLIPLLIALVFFLTAKFSLAVPAAVVERLDVIESVKRSWSLSNGSVLRLILVIVLAAIISFALAAALSIPYFIGIALAVKSKDPSRLLPFVIWQYVADFISRSIAFPIATIAVTLIYYDERVRKEAFDLQLMMEAIGQPPPPPPLESHPAPGTTSTVG